MVKLNEQELNKKLAEWAGFYQSGTLKKGYHLVARGEREIDWFTPEGYTSVGGLIDRDWGSLPLFYRSLDACFKWLVPKIIKSADYSIIITQNLARCIGYVRPMQGGRQYDATDNRSPALALCLAIERLIDDKV